MKIKLGYNKPYEPPVILEFEGTMKEWLQLGKLKFVKYEIKEVKK